MRQFTISHFVSLEKRIYRRNFGSVAKLEKTEGEESAIYYIRCKRATDCASGKGNRYIESQAHYLLFHVMNSEREEQVVRSRGKISDYAEKMLIFHFLRPGKVIL
mgnify:CR=1 FL=1